MLPAAWREAPISYYSGRPLSRLFFPFFRARPAALMDSLYRLPPHLSFVKYFILLLIHFFSPLTFTVLYFYNEGHI